MVRFYWIAILSLVALLTTAAAEPESRHSDNDRSETGKQKVATAGKIAGTTVDASMPSRTAKGCSDLNEKRDSDLCAQWKSADAARDAAEYAFWSLIVGVIGTIALIWTLLDTRLSAIRQQRAYIRVDQRDGFIQPDKPILIPLAIINYGSTPARKLVTWSATVVRKVGWDWSDDPDANPVKHRPTVGVTVHPGNPHLIQLGTEEPINRAVYNAIMSGQSAVYFRGVIDYKDVFGRWRKTTFQFEFHGSDRGNSQNGLLRISQSGNDAT